MLARMERTKNQGHRLSSYASSSTKHSPKTPKKSSEKLPGHGSIDEEFLSHHLTSAYSHTGINSQSKDQHSECILKCTCNNSSYNSLKSLKSSCGNAGRLTKFVRVSCDAATSPDRSNYKSVESNMRWMNQNISTIKHELHTNDDQKIKNKSTPSPRRLISTKNAATSPDLVTRKIGPKQFETALKSPNSLIKTVLEKSSSLKESKPSRQLRTTRSLSPRPPVRHQHAIMVSDENDIISIKISPNDDFDTDTEEKKAVKNVNMTDTTNTVTIKKHKAQSEQTSPNLSDFDATFTYDKSTNKSTGCLVYVPSDPWLKMSDVNDGETKRSYLYSKSKFVKLSKETRSLSRENLFPLDSKDPWIWRNPNDRNTSINDMESSMKQEIYCKKKSFSATKFEISNSGKIVAVVPANVNDIDNCAKVNKSRPKLQHYKSSIVIDDLPAISLTKDSRDSCTCNINSASDSNQSVLSPRKDLNVAEKSTNNLAVQQNRAFLNVINPNLVQSRHSFSSISQKDDELQLNIRRLSEQIKNTNQASGADFSDYLNQFKFNETKKIKTKTSTKHDPDSVLETTC